MPRTDAHCSSLMIARRLKIFSYRRITSRSPGKPKCFNAVNVKPAYQTFDEVPHRNVLSINRSMVDCINGRNATRGLEIFNEQLQLGIPLNVDEVTVALAFKSCGGNAELTGQVHGFTVGSGYCSMDRRSRSQAKRMRRYGKTEARLVFSLSIKSSPLKKLTLGQFHGLQPGTSHLQDAMYQNIFRLRIFKMRGMEAVGEVVAVGSGLTGRKVGDIVAYAGHPMGSYAEEQILPASKAIPVPPSIDPVVAASAVLKGMTTQYLVRRCFKVERGHTILIQAAAGGVGSLLCQWAHALGATVIGTVSTREKADQARADGCHHAILYKEVDVVSRVNEITSGNGVDVVYDSVGKDTFEGSLACLKVRGYMVSFGQSSGSPDPIALSALASKSLFLTRPTMFHYTSSRDELLETAGEVFANIASGVLRVRVNHTYALADAAKAHADLEGRKTSGSIVLIP